MSKQYIEEDFRSGTGYPRGYGTGTGYGQGYGQGYGYNAKWKNKKPYYRYKTPIDRAKGFKQVEKGINAMEQFDATQEEYFNVFSRRGYTYLSLRNDTPMDHYEYGNPKKYNWIPKTNFASPYWNLDSRNLITSDNETELEFIRKRIKKTIGSVFGTKKNGSASLELSADLGNIICSRISISNWYEFINGYAYVLYLLYEWQQQGLIKKEHLEKDCFVAHLVDLVFKGNVVECKNKNCERILTNKKIMVYIMGGDLPRDIY